MGWEWVGGAKDIHYAFFGNVVRGKSALFGLVVRNGFANFVRKVFAHRKLLPGKFWVFAPLLSDYVSCDHEAPASYPNTVIGEVFLTRLFNHFHPSSDKQSLLSMPFGKEYLKQTNVIWLIWDVYVCDFVLSFIYQLSSLISKMSLQDEAPSRWNISGWTCSRWDIASLPTYTQTLLSIFHNFLRRSLAWSHLIIIIGYIELFGLILNSLRRSPLLTH